MSNANSYSTAQIELDERLAIRVYQGDGMTLAERQRAQYLILEAIRMRSGGPNGKARILDEREVVKLAHKAKLPRYMHDTSEGRMALARFAHEALSAATPESL